MSLSPALYANLPQQPVPIRSSAADRKAEAARAREAESRLKRKADQADRVVAKLEQRAAGFAAGIKALQQRQAATLARIERIEERTLEELSNAGLKEAFGYRVRLVAHPCPPALVIDDASLIPAKYLRQPPPPPKAPDKVAIKQALARNEQLPPEEVEIIPGVHLAQRVSLVRR